MEIELILYGIARDIVGQPRLKMEIQEGTTVGIFLLQIKSSYPEFGNLKSLLVAVNDEYVDNDYMIKAEDEIVLVPPVSGG